MSESKSPFDWLIQAFVSVILAIALLQVAISLVVGALVSAWNATFGQPAVGLIFTIFFWLIAMAFVVGLLVRFAHGLGNFWRSILEQFHGPRAARAGRTRGAEHLDGPPTRRRREHEDDPPLPFEDPRL